MSRSGIPVAWQKCAKTSATARPRCIRSSLSSPVSSSPAPIRTASWISSVRFHHASSAPKTTSRNELDPRSATAVRCTAAQRYPTRQSGPHAHLTRHTGAMPHGEKIVGYGDTLSTEQANDLFDTWCPRRYAQGFVLYKLYTYAAAVSAR